MLAGMATLTLDQVTLSAGQADRSRSDGEPGRKITITASEEGVLELMWAPLEDTQAELESTGPTTWDLYPAGGVSGTYLFEFRPTAVGGSPVRRAFAIRTPNRGLRKPALNEGASPAASLVNDGPEIVAVSDFNEGDGTDGGRFAEGNYGGWYTALMELFDAVENLSTDAEPPTELQFTNALLALGPVTDGDYLRVEGNQLVSQPLVVPRVPPPNIYIEPPDAPHAFDDEFDSSEPDLALRGWTFRSSTTGQDMIRVGDVDPAQAPQQFTLPTHYRSTIYGSTLYLQTQGAMLYKVLPPGTTQMRVAARMWPSIVDPDSNWSGVVHTCFMGAALYQQLPTAWPYNGLKICCTVLHMESPTYARLRLILNDAGYRYNYEAANVDRNNRGDLFMVEQNIATSRTSHGVVDALAQRVMRASPSFTVGGPAALAAGGVQLGQGAGTIGPDSALRHWTCIDYIRFRPIGSWFPR